MFTCGPGLFGGVASDPYWAYVVSLCHYQGLNGSTTIIDEVPGVTWTAGTGTTISTAQHKFGTSSLSVGNGGSYTSQNFSISTTAFTYESFIYTSSASTNQAVWKILPNFPNIVIYNNNMQFSNGSAWVYGTGATVPTNTWVHIAVSYASGTLYFFINGVMKGNSSTSVAASSGILYTGADQSNNHVLGYLGESRITSGICRYTSNFTPPVAPFPNS